MMKLYQAKTNSHTLSVMKLVVWAGTERGTSNDFPEIKEGVNLQISKHATFEQY